MKIIYRIVLTVLVFIGALLYFGSNMPELVSGMETGITHMSEAEIPYLSLAVGEHEINLLHGYASEVDAALLYETVTPLDAEQIFDVLITEGENTIKKLRYEIRTVSGVLVEEGTVQALESTEDGRKSARVRLAQAIENDTEYRLDLILVNAQGRKYYYYTALKAYQNPRLAEHLDFVMGFHRAMFSKEEAQEYKQYMESRASSDASTLAKVDIHSNFDLLTWGNLTPSVVKEPVASITGIYPDIASVVLAYEVTAMTGTGLERYEVEECFRVRYAANRMYLLNYERTMEAIFDPMLFSVSRSEFKLGITSQTEVPYLLNDAGTTAAFVRGREVWGYHMAENELVKVFGFRQMNSDFVRDNYDNHEVCLLRVDEAGNIDFMVYGYMNRGAYEGKMALVFYRYYRQDKRIEEQLYIPLEEPWQLLKEEVGGFAYRNALDLFYFSLYDTLYVYNMTSETLSVIAQNIAEEEFVYSQESGYAAWTERGGDGNAKRICVLALESGEIEEIKAGRGETLTLLGAIDENMICGYAKTDDIAFRADGTRIEAMSRIAIVSPKLELLKDYKTEEGLYVTGISVEENVITLRRVKKTQAGYEETGTDSILNRVTQKQEALAVTKRVTELTLTEYYLRLPAAFAGGKAPSYTQTVNTVITEDTTLRIGELIKAAEGWYATRFGRIIDRYAVPGEAVMAADQAVGTVISKDGRIVWERGVKGTSAKLEVETVVGDSVAGALQMLFASQNAQVDVSGLSFADNSIRDAFEQYTKAVFLDLKGASLDQVLYYVYMKCPVIAFLEDGTAVVITAYDSQSITYQNPENGRTVKLAKAEAQELFEKAGNAFFSCIQ